MRVQRELQHSSNLSLDGPNSSMQLENRRYKQIQRDIDQAMSLKNRNMLEQATLKVHLIESEVKMKEKLLKNTKTIHDSQSELKKNEEIDQAILFAIDSKLAILGQNL